MIPAQYYTSVYYSTLAIITLLMSWPLSFPKGIMRYSNNLIHFNTVFLTIFVIGFIGLRDPFGDWRYLKDTATYSQLYQLYYQGFVPPIDNDIGFYFFMKLASGIMNVQSFYVLCAALYVCLPYFAFKRWMGKYAFFGLMLYVIYPFFWNYGINGLRNGLATSIVIYALSFQRSKWVWRTIFFCISYLIHNSVIIAILAYSAAMFIKSTRRLLYIWCFTLVFSLLLGGSLETWLGEHVVRNLGLMGDRTQRIFANEIDGILTQRRFRWDFVVFSAIPILWGYLIIIRKKFSDQTYIRLFHTYLVANIFWLFFISAAYTNRIVYLSWFLIPIVFAYPFTNTTIRLRHSGYLHKIILGNLSTTLLLHALDTR